MSVSLNRAMFSGADDSPKQAELNRYADAGVRVFLAAYGQP
jgi:TetR/AcrR family transcriptional repressor of mexJK operon